MTSVPRDDHTPQRSIRVSDELWDAALREAADRGEPLSEAIRRFLERYVRRID